MAQLGWERQEHVQQSKQHPWREKLPAFLGQWVFIGSDQWPSTWNIILVSNSTDASWAVRFLQLQHSILYFYHLHFFVHFLLSRRPRCGLAWLFTMTTPIFFFFCGPLGVMYRPAGTPAFQLGLLNTVSLFL